jgi:hypothetical protein
MKSRRRKQNKRNRWLWVSPLALCVAAASTVTAAEGDAVKPAATEPEQPAATEPAEPVETEAAEPAETSEEAAKPTEEAAEAPAEPTPQQIYEGGAETYNNWIEFGVGPRLGPHGGHPGPSCDYLEAYGWVFLP